MSLLILYGSETGTAQDVAESLRREAEIRKCPARVFEMDEYDLETLGAEQMVIFVVSTTGQGEMPPNMRQSWRFLLRKSLGDRFLENTTTTVIGLGDSSYQKYNFAGKKLYRRLIQLGARMLGLCLADDQHELGADGAIIEWKKTIWNEICAVFPEILTEIDRNTVEIRTKYRFIDSKLSNSEKSPEFSDFYPLKVVWNRRVTSEDHFQETRLVRFGIAGQFQTEMRYAPGDVLMVRPYNPPETVEIAIEALGFSEETLRKPVQIVKNDEYVKSPPDFLVGNPTTLLTCLQRLFDLQQVPKRSFFEILAYFSTDPAEKERLFELASPEGVDDLLDYANRSRRTCAEALRDFPATAKVLRPDQLFELFPSIRPRAFSIASAPAAEFVELLVAKVEYKSRMADKRRGLCSTYISRLQEGDEVFCKVRPGTFKFPPESEPVICVGPGTGVAPFRSLLTQRAPFFDAQHHQKSILFFGCRNEAKDFYFAEEWPKLENLEVVTAFSRDSEEKTYVQHKMAQRPKKLENLINSGARIFVAGSSGEMPKEVTNVIKLIKGDEWVKSAEMTGRIQFETWN